MEFTPQEKTVLAAVQRDLPDSPAPYADLAALAGISESDVLALLRRLKAQGVIRRFGASIRHQKSGYTANVMAAWAASPEEADEWAPLAAENRHISHVYFRPSPGPEWPYTLYTMIHGKSDADCRAVVDGLLARWPLREYALLKTMAELKKTSMLYFT